MGFKSKITPAKRAQQASEKIVRLEAVLLSKLHIVGEKFIAESRSLLSKYKYIEARFKGGSLQTKDMAGRFRDTQASGQKIFYWNKKKYIRNDIGGTSFSDWTENLRNSIGYFIFQEGELVDNNIGAGEGAEKATALAYSVTAPLGLSIVFTAGMNYAAAVEAKGYDVITGAYREALKNLAKELKDLENKAKRVLK